MVVKTGLGKAGTFIVRSVPTSYLLSKKEHLKRERERERQREEAGPVERSGELAKRERERGQSRGSSLSGIPSE